MRPFKTPFPADVLASMQSGVMRYRYKGIPCYKSPLDLAIYMKLLWELKPRTIIEIGSKEGGSAMFFADMAQLFGLDARIYSIDLEPPDIEDSRITFLQGDVHHLEQVFSGNKLYAGPRPWFVNEDSAHAYPACLAALHMLADNMQTGDVLAMEDGNLVELGLSDRYDGGPNRAITEFFKARPDAFKIRTDLCDMFGQNATYNPNGYLERM